MLTYNISREFATRGLDTHLIYLSSAESIRTSVDLEIKMKNTLSDSGVMFHEIGHDAKRNPIAAASRLRRTLNRLKPDILHIHLPYGLLIRPFVMSRLPTVYTHHSIKIDFPDWVFRFLDRFVDRYVGICRSCSNVLESHVRRPVSLIYNGIPDQFAVGVPRNDLPIHPKVLSVGVLREPKDYGTLLEAVAILVPMFRGSSRSISFRIAGGGSDEKMLREKAEYLGVDDHVEFLGTRSDIADLMAESDLLVSSSLWEGFPISMIEAAASGLPVVATSVGGVPEIVLDERSGVLVPPRRPTDLANAIHRTLSDANLYSRLSAGAVRHAKSFGIKTCADKHLELYADILRKAECRN